MSEKTKFNKDSLGRLTKNQAKHLICIVIYCLAKIYVEYFEKLIQGRVLKYLSIYFIVWVWEHKYNMYAKLLRWYGSRHQATEVPLFQCSVRLTRLSAVSNDNSKFFLTRLDILIVSLRIWMISYSHSHITWKPRMSNHLQIKYNQENVGMFYVVLSENVRRATSTIT